MKNRMNQLLKTGISLMMLVCLLFSGMAPAFAADNPLPYGTQSGKTGSITIHKYVIDGKPVNVPTDGFEIAEDDARLEGAAALQNVGFTVTKITAASDDKSIGLDNYKVDSSFTPVTVQTASNGTAVFSDLPIGYYLVQEVDNPLVTLKADDFIVAIPMTDPSNGNSYLFDVHAYPKNNLEAEPSVNKSVTTVGNTSETVGSAGTEDGQVSRDAKFILTAELPSDIHLASRFALTDTIDTRLTYVAGQQISLKAMKNDRTGEVVLTQNTHYNVIEPAFVGGTLTIELTEAGRKACEPVLAGTGVTPKAILEAEFVCKVNDSALTDDQLGNKIPNKTTLLYTNSFGYSYEYESNEVEVHTAGFKLRKVEEGNMNKVLSGAKFKLYNSESDAKKGINAVKDAEGNELEVTTDENGIAVFSGLPYGTTGDTFDSAASRDYWVVETQTPVDPEDGTYYELLRSPFKVTVNRVSHLSENTITVTNAKPFVLPATGLISENTVLIGAVLVAASGILLFILKKKEKTNKA